MLAEILNFQCTNSIWGVGSLSYITKLYDGGWHEWLQTPDNPVQLGDPESETVTYTTVAEI